MASKELSVPIAPAEDVTGARNIHLAPYLTRYVPFWGQPTWLDGNRWRAVVRSQPLATICRDTLISNILSMDWDIISSDPEKSGSPEIKKAITYYQDLISQADGDFDRHVELMCQDMLDLPFGGISEVGTENDDPDGPVVWIEHIDGATCYPTQNPDFPAQQYVREVPGRVVTFPKHAIRRMYMTPRPEILRKGWGTAPPEKIYLAMEMLSRGDRYYANLLIDTPEAGILDLLDMSEESATEWIEGFRALFSGIDGFKVPILYNHATPAQWIPFNRPPSDMLYDQTYLKYAQIAAAGYGMRLSDIGMHELAGDKTLAGVIRSERQTRRSGFALVRTRMENYWNSIVPPELKFIWLDDDEEMVQARGKALSAMGSALVALTTGGLLDRGEGRAEIVASGLLRTDIDPMKLPESPQDALAQAEAAPFPFGAKKKADGEEDKVPPSQGGRGDVGVERSAPGRTTDAELREMMARIVKPGMDAIVKAAEPIRIRRLVKAAIRVMLPQVKRSFAVLDDEQIESVYLPEMTKVDFEMDSMMDSLTIRQEASAIRAELDRHLDDDQWWRGLTERDKSEILKAYVKAYEFGMAAAALEIVRTLYEEGLRSEPGLIGIDFSLVNRTTLRELERAAAQMVTNVNDGTKFFIRRVVTAGVRQGLSSPKIAQAIREGGTYVENILRDEMLLDDIYKLVTEGLVEMSVARANSIVNTEVNRAENEGRLGQMVHSGLRSKAWRHLGERGVTEKGNEHPCPICLANEELGFVPVDYVYKTVFPEGALTPPAHPAVCHCTLTHDEQELFDLVSKGAYNPWTGK